jgi:iron complex outermembrane receptor protein
MTILSYIRSFVTAAVCALAMAQAHAENFRIPAGDLKAALDTYAHQTGVALIVSGEAIKGVQTKGVTGNLSSDDALLRILSGTGFVVHHHSSAGITIVRGDTSASVMDETRLNIAAAPAPTAQGAALETVTVTSSKIGGDVQNIPISITALSQEQLTATQTAGGPDLVKQVPNLTFTKTNFTGYSIQIRGIGTQAISVSTDPAVAVALNDIPFIRNHFFEQEFYDLSQAEVLRGPQGTIYGRNATAGVVNLVTAKPSDQFEAMASADFGNYQNRRFEGMINIPVVDDRLDIRAAGEWTKRNGYSFNELTDRPIDGRDLWSGRLSVGLKPFQNVQTTLVWEHFSEDDDRMRTSKQLCTTMPWPATIGGQPFPLQNGIPFFPSSAGFNYDLLSQGCKMGSLYAPSAFGEPEPFSLPYYAIIGLGARQTGVTPYVDNGQSQNLRVIQSTINPVYKAKNDTVELNSDVAIAPQLTLTSQTGYNADFLWSTEDYNRYNSAPGVFESFDPTDPVTGKPIPNDTVVTNPFVIFTYPDGSHDYAGTFCDPQVGCSDRITARDVSDEHAWQLSQEFRLASNFSGPLNFSVGGNYLHYETEENYYVFINTLTLFAISFYSHNLYGQHTLPNGWTPGPEVWTPGVSGSMGCQPNGTGYSNPSIPTTSASNGCVYIDPNPYTNPNNEGHNYFLSQNPYTLNSYAGFGEVYYNIIDNLKLTGGLRWTEDRKHFVDIPSELLVSGYGYTSTGIVDQQWDQLTGRAVVNWTPKFDFTDQTLIYGSYSHGYKAGGANPPGAALLTYAFGDIANPIHPLTFKPEFIDAYELGTKNSALDGALTLNGDIFFYNYKSYQISEIVDRTAINLNFDATVKGAELEATWEPLAGLRFNFAGGYEYTRLANGSKAVDLMDRTAGNPDWIVNKPFPTQASNCIMPVYVIAAEIANNIAGAVNYNCETAYSEHLDPVTCAPYMANPSGQVPVENCNLTGTQGDLPPGAYPGFDPLTAPNNGQGIDKDLSGNKLPNAPPFTVSVGAQYTMPLTTDWAGTLRGDYYWQDYSWARVFNDNPYDRLRGYTNVNLALILTNQNGWQVMGYVKNIFDATDITGTFLNSDDSGLTTNVFMTDPRLIGIRVTKNW